MAVREIGASITMDATTFKREMSAVNSNLAGLQSEMKATTAEFASNANSVEALTAKQKLLDQQEQQQKAKVAALTKAYAEQAAATGENSVEADKLRKQLNNARADYAKTRQAAEANTRALDEARESSGKLAAAKEKLHKTAETLSKGLKAVKPAAQLAGKGLEVTAEAAKKLTAAGAAAVTTLATLGAAGVSVLSGYATDAADRAKEKMDEAEGYRAEAEEKRRQADEAAAKRDKKTAQQLYAEAEELEKKAAAAAAEVDARFSTLAENMTKLDEAATRAKDALGTLLLPALEGLSTDFTMLLRGFSTDLNNAAGDPDKMAKVVSRYIKRAAAVIKKELPGLIRLGGDILGAVVEGLGDAMPDLLAAAGEIVDLLLDSLIDAADGMGEGISRILSTLLGGLSDRLPDLVSVGLTILSAIVQSITGNADQIVDAIVEGINGIVDWLAEDDNLENLLNAAVHIVTALANGFVKFIGNLVDKLPMLIEKIVAWFTDGDALESLWGAGAAIVDALWEGLKQAWAKVQAWAANAVANLFNFTRGEFDSSYTPGPQSEAVKQFEEQWQQTVAEMSDEEKAAFASMMTPMGRNAGGLNYVPYDNYSALLHRGERVLTAAENSAGTWGGGGARVVNLTVNPREMTRAQQAALIRRANDELGRSV